jgi:hypothetical protein
MFARQAHDAFFASNLHDLDVVNADRWPDNPAINLAVAQARAGVREVEFLEQQPRIRPQLFKLAGDLGKELHGRANHEPDSQCPFQSRPDRIQLTVKQVHRLLELLRLFEHLVSGRGQYDAAGGALEQRESNVLLELDDGLRQRRLRDVQALCRSRKARLARNGDERSYIAELDIHKRIGSIVQLIVRIVNDFALIIPGDKPSFLGDP